MATATAEWGTYGGWHGFKRVHSVEAALSLCSQIEAHEEAGRVLVGFTTDSGHFFAIGLGAEDSCAMYWESVDPPYFQSRGSRTSEGIDFAYDGQHTELPGSVRISRHSALQALAEFMTTGQRPQCIEWEQT